MLRKRSAHVLSLCAWHERRRVQCVAIAMASIVPLLVGVLWIGGATGWLTGAGVMAVMLLIGRRGSHVLSAQSVDHEQARYLGACDAFFARIAGAAPRIARLVICVAAFADTFVTSMRCHPCRCDDRPANVAGSASARI
nr:hypothetical protein [Xanthomonas arboricola]